MSGLSVFTNLAAGEANLELDRSQQKLRTSARNLASGLRINDASDDPSGLAIAIGLQTQVDAFHQASQNVQNAANMATIAEAALSTTTEILQRIRSIAVEAASSVESTSDRENLQVEIGQLLLEINRISQNTNFNGVHLLDGSHAGFVAEQDATAKVTANSVLATNANVQGAGVLVTATNALPSIQPGIVYQQTLSSAVVASAAPQTVQLSSVTNVVPGTLLVPSAGGSEIQVLSVNSANNTITAIFPQALAAGTTLQSSVLSSLASAVGTGEQVANLTGAAQPLYVGQQLQVLSGATSELVTVQQVLSPTSFVADFQYAHTAGTFVGSVHLDGIPAGTPAGNFTISYAGFGIPAWVQPVGGQVTIMQTAGYPANNFNATVVAINGSTFTINLPQAVPSGARAVGAAAGGASPINPLDGTIKLQVVNTGVSIAVQETFYDTATQTQVTSAVLLGSFSTSAYLDNVKVSLGAFTTADVGTTSYIKVNQMSAALTNPNNPALYVHSGANEGDTLALGLQAVNTQTLRVSTITVVGSTGADPTLAAEDTIGQIDFALEHLLGERAQLGAYMVRLTKDARNDDIAAVQLQASESSIRDVNVGAETSEFTRDQVLVSIGTSVLGQANNLPQNILRLFR